MRNVIVSAFIFLLASCAGSDWTLTQDSTGKTYPAQVPSTVAAVLLENGVELTPEALEGSFTYSTVFKAYDPSLHYTLRFDGRLMTLRFITPSVLTAWAIMPISSSTGIRLPQRIPPSASLP